MTNQIDFEWIKSTDTPNWDPRATSVMAEAFLDEPWFMAMVADEQLRREFARVGLKRHCLHFLKDSFVLVDKDSGKNSEGLKTVMGHGAIYQRGLKGASVWEMLRIGMWKFPFEFGLRIGWRWFRSLAKVEKEIQRVAMADELFKDGKFWYLDVICIDPKYQGKGVGSRAFREIVAKADGTGLPTLLFTGREINVKFYQRLGFEVMEKTTVPFKGEDGSTGFTLWFMKRPVM